MTFAGLLHIVGIKVLEMMSEDSRRVTAFQTYIGQSDHVNRAVEHISECRRLEDLYHEDQIGELI